MTSSFALFIIVSLALATVAVSTNPDPSRISVANNGDITITPRGMQTLQGGESQDYTNLYWALNNLPRGGTIKLKAGQFHVSRMIVVRGFAGTIKGKGTDKTFIVGRGPLVGGQYEFPHMTPQEEATFFGPGFPGLFWFWNKPLTEGPWTDVSTLLTLRDITFTIEGGGPPKQISDGPSPARLAVWAMIFVSGSSPVYPQVSGSEVGHLEVDIKDCDFIAQGQSLPYGSNSYLALQVFGGEEYVPGDPQQPALLNNGEVEVGHVPVHAVINIRDCNIHNMVGIGFSLEAVFEVPAAGSPPTTVNLVWPDQSQAALPLASVSVTHCTFSQGGRGITYAFYPYSGVLLLAPSNVSIDISHNTFSSANTWAFALYSGPLVMETPQAPGAVIRLSHNTFDMVTTASSNPALEIFDIGPIETFRLFIVNNEFIGDANYAMPFITQTSGLSRVFIMGNTFSGHAGAAMNIGPWGAFTSAGATVMNNDFDDLLSSSPAIILGPGSRNVVVYKQDSDDVLDQGTGNVVVDGHNRRAPPVDASETLPSIKHKYAKRFVQLTR